VKSQTRSAGTVISRRELLKQSTAAAVVPLFTRIFEPAAREESPISALVPRGGKGHQFILYADCCSGRPGTPNEANFAAVNNTIQRLRPRPEFICFTGDNISGLSKDYASLRVEWDYWLKSEMAWLDVPLFNTTSNHNTYDGESERIFQEVFPGFPRNGPSGQEGLSYYVRQGDLLLVCANTSFSGLGGDGHVESEWLDRVLNEQADAAFKFVAGHFPIHAVNGYDRYPHWRVVPQEGEAFWKVLVRHGVIAYLCSHIIAFDVQVHEGVLQITSGGAGTVFGPGGFMPGCTEYLHAVQMAIDFQGLRCQVLDTEGKCVEWLAWPLSIPASDHWRTGAGAEAQDVLRTASDDSKVGRRDRLSLWRLSGVLQEADGGLPAQTLLCGWDDSETAPTIWVSFDGCPPRLTVRLLPQSGGYGQTWTGPAFEAGAPFDFQLALHGGMGPGGVLWRKADNSAWSSLTPSCSKGVEDLSWPPLWTLGYGRSGPSDQPFLGKNLKLSWLTQAVPRVQEDSGSNGREC
jgi:hypothetical protein